MNDEDVRKHIVYYGNCTGGKSRVAKYFAEALQGPRVQPAAPLMIFDESPRRDWLFRDVDVFAPKTPKPELPKLLTALLKRI